MDLSKIDGPLSEYQEEYRGEAPNPNRFIRNNYKVAAGVPNKDLNPDERYNLCDLHKETLPQFVGTPTSKRVHRPQVPVTQLHSFKPDRSFRPPYLIQSGKLEDQTQYRREFVNYSDAKPSSLMKPPKTVYTGHVPRGNLTTCYQHDFDYKILKPRKVCIKGSDSMESGDVCGNAYQHYSEDLSGAKDHSPFDWDHVKRTLFCSQNSRTYLPPSTFREPVGHPKGYPCKELCPAAQHPDQECKIHKAHRFG